MTAPPARFRTPPPPPPRHRWPRRLLLGVILALVALPVVELLANGAGPAAFPGAGSLPPSAQATHRASDSAPSSGTAAPTASAAPGGSAASGGSPRPAGSGDPVGSGTPAGSGDPVGSGTPVGSGSPGGSAAPGASQAPVPASDPIATLFATLDARIASWRTATGTPGVSATVILRDGTRWTGVAGLADVAKGTPVRPGTPFAAASLSKTFTAALVMSLVDQGRLRLDQPAAPLLAGTGVTLDPGITIAMLLDHTSGIGDYLVNPRIEAPWAAAPDARWTPAQDWAYQTRAIFQPGAGFYYSNANYLALGLIVEGITGRSVAANLREAFFDPLGLRTASYQGVESSTLPIARTYKFATDSATEPPTAMPGSGVVQPFMAVVTAAGAAGSAAMASTDVASWGRALYSGWVLPIATVGRMVDDATQTVALGSRLAYGYGVQVVAVDGHPTYGHTGRYLGARNVFRYFPLERITIAVMTNQSRADPADLLVDLLRITLASPDS